MAFEELSPEFLSDALIVGGIGALIAFGVFVALLIALAVYVYFALAWYSIAKKLNYKKPWMAWIPVANWAMILQLGGFSWAWIFLILVPIVGWIALLVLAIIAHWRIFETRGYPGWFSLSMLLPEIGAILYLIAIGFVAWKDKAKNPRKISKRKR